MSCEAGTKRPLSPPYSSDGDFRLASHETMPSATFTPPDPSRSCSNEPHDEPRDKFNRHIVRKTAYTSSPRMLLRHVNQRLTPVGVEPDARGSDEKLNRLSPATIPAKASPAKASSARKRKVVPRRQQGTGQLPGPLSEITKDYTVPVKDMEAWVNRSVEERLREAKKKNGHIARPMNSFMLYRSAYADRVKQYCKENNHQIVSKVTGQSWPMEPQEIRMQYERYANIERDNHQVAHPGYKFAPNKTGRKRVRSAANDSDSDSDGEWEGARSSKKNKPNEREISRSVSSTPFEDPLATYQIQYLPAEQQPSQYQAIIPRESVIYHFDPVTSNVGYYEPRATRYIEPVSHSRFGSARTFAPLYEPEAGLTSMPEGSEDLIGALGHPSTEAFNAESQIDPSLKMSSTHYSYGHSAVPDEMYTTPRSVPFDRYPPPPAVTYHSDPIHPGMITLSEPNEWHYRDGLGSDLDEAYNAY